MQKRAFLIYFFIMVECTPVTNIIDDVGSVVVLVKLGKNWSVDFGNVYLMLVL